MSTAQLNAADLDTTRLTAADLVRLWKRPAAPRGATADHPAGEIRLSSAGGLGRRSRLLGGAQAYTDTTCPFTTISIEFRDESR